jgi:hypothetical protein
MAWLALGVLAGAFSLLVIGVAGLIGYWSGQNVVAEYAAATQQAFVQDQINVLIPTDIAAGNVALVGIRLEGLASLTPPPAEMGMLVATGTAFALQRQPTVTPTPSPTPTITPTVAASAAPTQTTIPTVPAEGALYDLDALYAEAQAQLSASDYDAATRTLDAIIAIDPTYRTDELNGLILRALTTQAAALLRSGTPDTLAAGIVKANEASRYGDIGELTYEVYIAGLYLNAASREATDPLGAITGFSNVVAQAPNYLNTRTRLYNLRVKVGDEAIALFDACAAVPQYQAALQLFQSGDVELKLQSAQTACSSGQAPVGVTPNADGSAPVVTTTPAGPSPIGQRQ